MNYPRLCLLLLLLVDSQVSLLGASYADGMMSVNVSTDKQSYGPGEVISITGRVSDETAQGVAFASVSIQVNDPKGNPVHLTSILSGADGSFSDEFTIPAGSGNGGYTVFATASKPGYTDANSQTAYAVIPEFQSTAIPWLIPFSILFVMLLIRRERSTGS